MYQKVYVCSKIAHNKSITQGATKEELAVALAEKDRDGVTPVGYALNSDSLDILEDLFDAGLLLPDFVDEFGRTLLHLRAGFTVGRKDNR